MKHKRNHYRPFPLDTAVIAAEFINRHIRIAFDEFLDTYFPDTSKALKDRLSPRYAEWAFEDLGMETPFFYIQFVCDIDADAEKSTRTGTLRLVSEVTDGMNIGHYRCIQVMDDNQKYFDCLYYRDIQTAVKVRELLASGKEAKALKLAYAQPDTALKWAYKVEDEMK